MSRKSQVSTAMAIPAANCSLVQLYLRILPARTLGYRDQNSTAPAEHSCSLVSPLYAMPKLPCMRRTWMKVTLLPFAPHVPHTTWDQSMLNAGNISCRNCFLTESMTITIVRGNPDQWCQGLACPALALFWAATALSLYSPSLARYGHELSSAKSAHNAMALGLHEGEPQLTHRFVNVLSPPTLFR